MTQRFFKHQSLNNVNRDYCCASRSYFVRKIRDEFKEAKSLTKSSDIHQHLESAQQSLKLIQRQVI